MLYSSLLSLHSHLIFENTSLNHYDTSKIIHIRVLLTNQCMDDHNTLMGKNIFINLQISSTYLVKYPKGKST